jgi:hypothetical protein
MQDMTLAVEGVEILGIGLLPVSWTPRKGDC